MADDTDVSSLISGLKSDVDQHVSAQQPPAQSSAPAPSPITGLISGLKSDVDAHIRGEPLTPPDAPSLRKSRVDLAKMTLPQKIMHYESQGKPDAKNPNSTATGAGQFINTTWLPTIKKHRPDLTAGKSDEEILALRNDPALSEQMIEAHAADNAEKLKAAGVPVSDATKYGAHWFGADKFTQIAKADPKTPIEKLIGQHAADINGLSGQSADDVKTLLSKRMGDDYIPQDESWGDTLTQAGSNLHGSVGKMLAGVYHSVRHPIDTYQTLKQIGIGLDSKINGIAGENQNPEKKAQDEALVDALARDYKGKYGTVDGFKQYLAHDPAGVLMDASTVLSGGGGLAAKLPGIAGKAGEIAGTVGRLSNPLNPLGLVSGTVKAVTSPTKALDAAGNITPKVDAIIKKVTKNGMSAADITDPQTKAAFAETVARKGVSEASVKEGLLRSLGLKAPTAIVEGTAPPAAARELTADSIASNNEKLAAHASKLGNAPSPSSLGEALDTAHTASMNKASAAYNSIRMMPGSFGATMPDMGAFGKRVKANLDKSGIPIGDIGALRRSGYPQSADALKLINDYWGSGKSLTKSGQGDINAPEILAMRKALNNFKDAASGSDVKGVHDVINAFDDHLSDLSSRGLFKDPSGRSLPNIGTQIKAANSAYRQHFNTFETSNGSNNAIVSAVKKLKSGQGRTASGDLTPSGDHDLYTQAQGTLAKDLIHPQKGAATYNNLQKAIGNTTPIDEHIRSLLSNPDTKGAADLLNSPVGQKAFKNAPDDLARARHIHAASALNNAKPGIEARSTSILKGVLGSLAGKGIGTLAGYEALGPTGLVVGPMVEHTLAKVRDARQSRRALAGAQHTQSLTGRTLGRTARGLTNPTALRAEHYIDEAKQQNQPIARASGGKVDTDELVERLMRRWKQVKKDTDATTKPLMHADDNVVAKALRIAQENI